MRYHQVQLALFVEHMQEPELFKASSFLQRCQVKSSFVTEGC